jgi:hypothetical protein
MLDMSQTDIADALGLTFQQFKNTRRAPTAWAPADCSILQIPFFFEGGPAAPDLEPAAKETDFPASHVTDFLATSDGLSLVTAFMLIEDPKLRRAIVRLVEEIAPEDA